MPRTVAIVQARMGSDRLPGKALKPVLGRPLLEYLIRQLRYCERLDDIVIATSDLPRDDAIEEVVCRLGGGVFRGSELDVLDRYRGAAAAFDADRVVRITADCPLMCPTVVDRTVDDHAASGCDYTMNDVPGTLPRGYDVEVFSRDTLNKTHGIARRTADREHVTYYVYTHPEEFSINRFRDAAFPRFPTDRLCVDTQADFEAVKAVIENVYDDGRYMHHADVLEFLDANPEIIRINAGVAQKGINKADLQAWQVQME